MVGKMVSTNDNPPYTDLTTYRIRTFKARFDQGSAKKVAKVVFEAIMSADHLIESRCLEGNDAFKLMKSRKIKSNEEF